MKNARIAIQHRRSKQKEFLKHKLEELNRLEIQKKLILENIAQTEDHIKELDDALKLLVGK